MDPITIAIMIAVLILAEALRPKPKIESQRPPGLGDFNFPTAEEGRPIPLVWGRVLTQGPNVVWYGDLRTDVLFKKIKTGLFSSKRTAVGYKYYLGVQMALCRGQIDGVRQVWIGDKRVKDGSTLSTSTFDVDLPLLYGGDETGQGGVQATVSVYLGSTSQAADAYLGNFQDAGAGSNRTPAYRGTAYLVLRGLGKTGASTGGAYLGNQTSVEPWKLEVERYPALFSGQSSGENKVNSGVDANPINALYELLTNSEWGFGYASSLVDVGASSSFRSAATTMSTEGNGFSMLLDSGISREDFQKELERQIGGVCVWDHAIGKYKIKLARADYDVNTVAQATASNVLKVENFTRGAWTDTTNFVQLKYNKRDDVYKETFALATDGANAQIQGGDSVTTTLSVASPVSYPGVKNPTLAGQLAWRDLRSLSYPLAKVDLTVDRTFWATTPGDVVAWTDATYGLTKMPLRVLRADYGQLGDERIILQCVQDVFYFAASSFGVPPSTSWTVPSQSLIAFPTTDQLAFEAPRAVVERDPQFSGDIQASKVLCAARKQGGETTFQVRQRHSSGTPSGSFTLAGEVVGFVKIGSLDANLAAGTAVPTTTITVTATPDSKAELLALFDGNATIETMGKDLQCLVRVGSEFMLVMSAQANGAKVDLKTVYRGVLDSVQMAHTAGDYVWMLFVGSGLADVPFVNTDNVDLELRARSPKETFAGSVTTISLTMDKRTLRPYPVANVLFDGSSTAYGTPNLQASGSGLNGLRTQVSWYRRDYRVADEVLALLSDGTTVDASTKHQLEVRADPTGVNTLVGSVSSYATGVGPLNVLLVDVVTAAAIGTTLRFTVRTEHDAYGYSALTNRHDLTFDVVPTAATYSGKAYLGGGLAANVSSASYTAAATGTFTLNIGAAQSTANIQVSVAGGGFSTVITPGNTTGTFSATSGQTIVVRRTVSESPNPNFVELRNPSAAVVGYGSFKL